jgi:simple sugar transport system permease protein
VTDQATPVPGQQTPATTARPRRDIREVVVKYGFLAVTVIFFVYFMATIDAFRMSSTMYSMLKFTSVVAIAGLGVTTTMVVGGLDLSVGATTGLSVTVAAMTMVIYAQQGGVAIIAVLIGGALIGAVNAFLIVVLKIPDLLATLAVMFLIQGLKLIPVDGQSVSSGLILRDGTVAPGKFTEGFLELNRGTLGPVPYPVIIWAVLGVFTWFLLSRTKWGRIMYAIGSNPEAARLAGARVGRYKGFAYILSGLYASVAGLILASRIGQGDISAGNSLLLDAVAVALVGTSVLGVNRPNAFGTTIGALLIGILLTGTTMMNFQYYWQDVVKGLVLLVALLFSFTLSARKRRFTAAVPL